MELKNNQSALILETSEEGEITVNGYTPYKQRKKYIKNVGRGDPHRQS